MRQIVITNQSTKFTTIIPLDSGEPVEIDLEYNENQYLWNMNIRQGETFVLNGVQLVNSMNLLRQYKNILLFGLCVYSDDKIDPIFPTDLYSGRIRIGILSSQEVDDVETRYT